jgi:hypothetical protein
MAKKKKVAFEISGTYGGATGAVKVDSEGHLALQFGIEKNRRKKK